MRTFLSRENAFSSVVPGRFKGGEPAVHFDERKADSSRLGTILVDIN
jgi:hypothetical protein